MDETSAIGHFRNPIEPLEADALGVKGGNGERAVACPEAHSLEAIVSTHERQVSRMAHRLLGSWDGVEDVVQEVFLAAFVNLDRFRGDSSLSTWLTAVTVHKCRSLIRRRTIRRRLLPWTARMPLDEQPERSRDVEESLALNEEVRRAVYRLPQKYREPVVLRYFEGLSIDDIAEALGLAANTVEVRLSRARKKLRGSLTERLMK